LEDSFSTLWAEDASQEFSISAIPEPATFGLLGAGLALVAVSRARKAK
jgi:hypothetical protein